MRLAKVDEQGLFIEDVIVKEYPLIEVDGEMVKDESYVSAPSQGGLYKPKWTGTEWVEGMAQTEIDTLKNVVQPQTLEEKVVEQDGVIADLTQLLVDKGVIF